ncbi:MAG: YvcK family protein [Candidatus Pacebacteria bacterium]|nr:YvcK family protein [Candidatus Paceibacterota bacterium]
MIDKRSIVVIGGGTGTFAVLSGLKQYRKQVDVTAVVTMADAGGSTGVLRDEFGCLPVGDVRMSLVALARENGDHDELLRQLFLYRFDKGAGLNGHNFGNLLLVALTDILGSEEAAISAAARVLRVHGRVVPVTTEKVDLVATYDDGSELVGEHHIDEPAHKDTKRITDLSIIPHASVNTRAEDALLNADIIVLGPGDLYTSVLANCVVDGVPEAIRRSGAQVVYVSSLMTKVGQTSGMGTKEQLAEITRFIGREPDVMLSNTAPLPEELLARYATENEYPVEVNCDGARCKVIKDDFLATEAVTTAKGDVLKRSLIRHDARKIAGTIIDLL